jgi:hypothetical protein
VRLLGRLLGPEAARRWAESHARLPAPAPAPASATAPEPAPAPTTTALALVPKAGPAAFDNVSLCRVAADPHALGRIAALHALRGRLEQAEVRDLTASLRADAANAPPERALGAIVAITELRDRLAVPTLIDLVESRDADVAEGARQALIEITKQDFGTSRRRWRSWMATHGDEARTDWLFAGLSHKIADIRQAAAEELWQITGEYFGYRFDAPKREREEARVSWQAWWREQSLGGGAA